MRHAAGRTVGQGKGRSETAEGGLAVGRAGGKVQQVCIDRYQSSFVTQVCNRTALSNLGMLMLA